MKKLMGISFSFVVFLTTVSASYASQPVQCPDKYVLGKNLRILGDLQKYRYTLNNAEWSRGFKNQPNPMLTMTFEGTQWKVYVQNSHHLTQNWNNNINKYSFVSLVERREENRHVGCVYGTQDQNHAPIPTQFVFVAYDEIVHDNTIKSYRGKVLNELKSYAGVKGQVSISQGALERKEALALEKALAGASSDQERTKIIKAHGGKAKGYIEDLKKDPEAQKMFPELFKVMKEEDTIRSGHALKLKETYTYMGGKVSYIGVYQYKGAHVEMSHNPMSLSSNELEIAGQKSSEAILEKIS